MSVQALTWALKQRGIGASPKFVLVCLANYANEEGECYPSWARLAADTCLSRATVARCLDELKGAGLIVDSGGRKGRTEQVVVWQVRWPGAIDPSQIDTGMGVVDPSHGDTGTRLTVRPVPVSPRDPEPSLDTKGEPKAPPTPPSGGNGALSGKNGKDVGARVFATKEAGEPVLPDWVPETPWRAWLDVRKRIRAPNTPRALELAVKNLEKLKGAGHDPGVVLDQSTMRGWRGLFPVKLEHGMPRDYSALMARLKD